MYPPATRASTLAMRAGPPDLPAGEAGAPYKVYCPQCWWSDKWDPFEYGRDYDFSRPFFTQFNELWHEVPLLGLSLDLPTTLSSPHCNHAGHLKNCYLLFHADFVEDSAYGFYLFHSKSLLDSSLVMSSELCYDSMNAFKDSRCIGVKDTIESLNCVFLRDCTNCQNCFGSAGLRNKKYHVFNKPHTKEDYVREIKKWDLGSYRRYQEAKQLAHEHWQQVTPKPRFDEMSVGCTGSYVFQSKNCHACYEVAGTEDSKYLFMVSQPPNKDCYDVSAWGNNMQRCYEGCVVGENVSDVRFCQETGINLYDSEYSKLSTGGSHHFGCVSVKKGDHVILNRRYDEESFNKLRAKIVAHMDEVPYVDRRGRTYRYGEFFPVELSPNPYNQTMAQKFFPLSRETIETEGWRWRADDRHDHAVTKPAADLPDHIKDVPDSIAGEVVGCASCGRGFKIIPMELQFRRAMNVPLPRECPFCRIDAKFSRWVTQLRSFWRTCPRCGMSFETHYPETEVAHLLCKKCYLQEVV